MVQPAGELMLGWLTWLDSASDSQQEQEMANDLYPMSRWVYASIRLNFMLRWHAGRAAWQVELSNGVSATKWSARCHKGAQWVTNVRVKLYRFLLDRIVRSGRDFSIALSCANLSPPTPMIPSWRLLGACWMGTMSGARRICLLALYIQSHISPLTISEFQGVSYPFSTQQQWSHVSQKALEEEMLDPCLSMNDINALKEDEAGAALAAAATKKEENLDYVSRSPDRSVFQFLWIPVYLEHRNPGRW